MPTNGLARTLAFSLAVAALAASLAAQRREALDDPGYGNLMVRVVYPDDRPVQTRLRVEVLATATAEIWADQGFTDDLGQITFRIRPGYYRVRVTGSNIEDVTTAAFVVGRGDSHPEYVRVQLKQSADASGENAPLPPVSLVDLNVPQKAQKEFDAGNAALREKNWVEAKSRFEKAIDIYSQYASAYNNLGVVFMNTGEPARGREAFEAAIRINDHFARAYLNLARILYSEKKFDETENLLTKSVASDPLNPETLLLLANVQLLLSKPEQAAATARRVHSMEHSQFTVVHLIAARALETLKRPDEAAAEYQLYLQESPAGPAAARARAGLQALQNQTRDRKSVV